MRLSRSRLALAVLPLSVAAHAQSASPPAAGAVSLDQFIARRTGRIMAADTDGDGKVSRAEMAALAKGGRDSSRRLDAMDTNHDGYLDPAEIRTALTRRFRRLDRNADGMVTPDERPGAPMRGKRTETAAPTPATQH